MSSNAKTIDNLGYNASRRYALDQKLLDGHEKIHQEAKLLFGQSQIITRAPALHSELDSLLNHTANIPAWANFAPPEGFFSHPKRLFTHQLLPKLAKANHLPELIKKVEKVEPDPQNKKEDQATWELEKEEKRLVEDKKNLTKLLNCILSLDNCMIYVSSKRSQYHKG